MRQVTDWNSEADSSGMSWSAVLAGAFVTAALSLALLALGAGFGLLSVSPWSTVGASAAALNTAAITWLLVNEIVASSAGGYLAGRLRTKWTSVHSDEVFFRDTAHGLLVWAVALVITAAFLGSATTTMVGGKAIELPNNYFVDKLLRPASGSVANASLRPADSTQNEVAGIMAQALREGKLDASNRTYLSGLIAQKTGLSLDAADQRISEVSRQAQQAADGMRKATARFLLWTFLALLIGAFCASYAGTIGGKHRDLPRAV